MKNIIKIFLTTCWFLVVSIQGVYPQGYNKPLSMQGLDQVTNASVASRAMGGTSLILKNDVSVMFSQPAMLQTLEGVQMSVGGLQQYKTSDQTQQWFVSSSYSMFSILMQGLSLSRDKILQPGVDTTIFNARDTVQRPFDSIGPDWEFKKDEHVPLQAFIAAPFSIGKIKCAGGLGAVEYALANYYYQNNNVLSPDIGSLRDTLFHAPIGDDISYALPVVWSQVIHKRVGSIYGYGGAFSVALSEKLSFGLSVMFLQGSTKEYERVVERGRLYFYQTYLGLYSPQYDTTKVGTSDYSGSEYTISGTYHGKVFSCGFAVKPPNMITREYKSTIQVDSASTILNSYDINGKDKMRLPWRGTFGIGVALRENFSIGLEYQYLPYSSAKYIRLGIDEGGVASNPWLDGSSIRLGFKYEPSSWLSLMGGYSTQTEVFEPEGNYNVGDPLSSSVYSCGIGVNYENIRLNIAYEYQNIQYEDKWQTNVNYNKNVRHNIAAGISYTIQ